MVSTAWKKLTSSSMAIVLALGLCPLPAMADEGLEPIDLTDEVTEQESSEPAPVVVTDPTQIESAHDPYGDEVTLAWSYTYPEDVDGLAITFEENSRTEEDCDNIEVRDATGKTVDVVSGNLRNRTAYLPKGNSFTIVFSSDGSVSDMYGFKVASVRPLTADESKLASLTEEAKAALFKVDNMTIDGQQASAYERQTIILGTDGLRLPEVAISDGSTTLVNGRDYIVRYYHHNNDENRAENVDQAGNYFFTISGAGFFNKHVIGVYDEEEDETYYTPFHFSVAADTAVLKAQIDSLDIPSASGIDAKYPNSDAKANAIRAFKDDLNRIELSVENLGDDAKSLIGDDAYAQYERARAAAEGFIDLSSGDYNFAAFVHDADGNETGNTAYYTADGNPIACDPILKTGAWNNDDERYDYTDIDPSNYRISYVTAPDYAPVDGAPTTPGYYTVIFEGLNNYYGEYQAYNRIVVKTPTLYAYIDEDTLTLTSSVPGVDEYYTDADDVEYYQEFGEVSGKWYDKSAAIKHVTVEPGTSVFDISCIFNGCSSIESVDFTNLDASYIAFDGDNRLFERCTSLKSIRFGRTYTPSPGCGLEGDWVNPDDPSETWDLVGLSKHLSSRHIGEWTYDEGTGLWALDRDESAEIAQVAIPENNKSFVYDGSEHVALSDTDAYTVSGTAKATGAGEYTVTAKLKNVATTEWSDGTVLPKTLKWSIARKSVTVTPDAASKTEGSADPAFTAKVSGTVGIDKVSYALSRNAGEAAGTYTISAKGEAVQGNYQVTFGTAAFKINAKPVVVTPTVTKVAIPAAKSFTYNGKANTAVAAGAGYTLSGTTSAKNAGSYTAVAKLADKAKYAWSDGTTADKTLAWSVAKAKNSKFKAAAKSKTLSAKHSKKTAIKASKAFKVSSANGGKVTYSKASGDKKITVAKNGTITVKKGLKKKTYTVKVKVKAAESANYKASSTKTVTLKIKVK